MSLPPANPTSSLWWRMKRWGWRLVKTSLVLVCLLVGGLLVGQIPVNRNFRQAEQGITLFVYADSAHSEVVVPLASEVYDWSPWFSANDFKDISGNESFVSFGWGDREFFLNTPHWEDIRCGRTARSMLLPTDTVMHVTLSGKPTVGPLYRRVVIEPEAYEKMVEFIQSHFVLEGSLASGTATPCLIAGHGYGEHDAFYQAEGIYSLFYTCNAWAGDALEVAGIRTGCWTPLPMGLLQIPSALDAK